jgi:predicted dinucleotide-binding enzyme
VKIGIIGAGNIGGTLARKLAMTGHTIKLAGSKGPDAIREQSEKIGAEPVTAEDAVKDVDVVILSIPFSKIPDVADVFAKVPADVVILDTSNYYPQRDGQIAEINGGKPESVWASEQLGRPVIKAFNAVLAHTLAENGTLRGAAGRIAIPVSGDDERGKAIAQELIDQAGFDALDAGDIENSWRQQPGTPAYCTELSLAELQKALVQADKDRAPLNRDALMDELMKSNWQVSHEQVLIRNREVTA